MVLTNYITEIQLMNYQKTYLLVLDDERDIREEINECLTIHDIRVYEAGTPAEAFSVLANSPVDIVILDINLPEMNGFDVFKEIQRLYPKIRVIMMSGSGNAESGDNALKLGASSYLQKPFRLHELLASIDRARNVDVFGKQMKYDLLSNQENLIQ
jgi:DNA-binding NtrC family response regulator